MTRKRRIATATALVSYSLACLLMASSLKADPTPSSGKNAKAGDDVGVSAFRDVASVLTSPRCLNCHLAGQSPLQGNDSHAHTMNVKRGTDGRGTPAMRCSNCHQSTNSGFAQAPPGAPDWRLPGAKTPMAWLGLSTGELCRAIKDPSTNGGRSLSSLLEHVRSDRIVNWGWDPGVGRTTPPLSHQQFVDKFNQWIDTGAPCPP